MNWKKFKPESFEYRGKWIYNWFSNMDPCVLEIDGLKYNSVENYYQAMKSPLEEVRRELAETTPSNSKKLGRRIYIRRDWYDVKYDIMKTALRVKWNKSPYRERLMDSGDDVIIEWNNWGDKIWGVTINDCDGANLLGKALMEIRDELNVIQNDTKIYDSDTVS